LIRYVSARRGERRVRKDHTVLSVRGFSIGIHVASICFRSDARTTVRGMNPPEAELVEGQASRDVRVWIVPLNIARTIFPLEQLDNLANFSLPRYWVELSCDALSFGGDFHSGILEDILVPLRVRACYG